MLACMAMNAFAQNLNVKGKVLDQKGNPLEGALVFVVDNPQVQVATDRNGMFEIAATGGNDIKVMTWNDAVKVVPIDRQKSMTVVMDFASENVDYGFGLKQNRMESTGAVSTVYAEDIDTRSAMSIGNSLFGNVAGLTTLQTTGNIQDQKPSMFIRGLHTLNGNNGVLLVIDGLERDNNWNALNYITPEEVESVSVLRDAAAVALYGYRGSMDTAVVKAALENHLMVPNIHSLNSTQLYCDILGIDVKNYDYSEINQEISDKLKAKNMDGRLAGTEMPEKAFCVEVAVDTANKLFKKKVEENLLLDDIKLDIKEKTGIWAEYNKLKYYNNFLRTVEMYPILY